MKNMICISSHKKGVVGLTGHAGIAHAHGANNYQQDDSAGFCAAGTIVARALGADTRIGNVSCTTEEITVTLKGGGRASTRPRRRVTPQEAAMMKRAEGMDALFSQAVAAGIFGRIYGQGAGETGACFQAALCLAVAETFRMAAPEKVFIVPESSDNAGCVLGTVVDCSGVPVSVVMPVNYTGGGIGPDEDYEGNYMHGEKGIMMGEIGYPLPSIVAESKVFSFLSDTVAADTFLIRYSPEKGNPAAAAALEKSCAELGLEYLVRDDLLSYDSKAFRSLTLKFADRLDTVALSLRSAEKASEKVRIIAELARMVSEDAASFTYMSSDVFAQAASPGLHPGTAAVLSMVSCRRSINEQVIPVFTSGDRDNYINIILTAIKKIAEEA